eukprot:m51a1_g10915 hypothetical protein (544) ;mRNA; r:82048-84150
MIRGSLTLCLLLLARLSVCCTNVIITPGATVDGSTFITYNADSTRRFGYLHFAPRGLWAPNSTVDLYNYETGEFIGRIDQVPVTYNVVVRLPGLMNEYQVSIGETTFGGLAELSHQPGALVDYGSLMYLALQRSRSAREAIRVMDAIVQRYGYLSSGESFSVADSREAWIMEMIGKGLHERGAARITTFPLDDPDNCMYSPDVVSFAKRHGLYPSDASDADFSFSDTYAPMTFLAARACEARVWSAFRRLAGPGAVDEYLDYALGHNLTHRMPLWVRPSHGVTLNETMALMRDHYEGTPLEMASDVGSAPFGAPYRWHPLQWSSGGRSYVNERPIATQQTGYGLVAQSRPWLPRQVGAVLWFAVDDTGCSVYFPAYACATRVPASYDADGGIMDVDFDKAFWVFNTVANYAYGRWDLVYPELDERRQRHEARFFDEVAAVDAKAVELVRHGHVAHAVELMTGYSERSGNELVADWWAFYKFLFARHMDGVFRVRGTAPGRPVITQPGYSAQWYQRIVTETGDRYLVTGASSKKRSRVAAVEGI